jgi:hypothetical protein
MVVTQAENIERVTQGWERFILKRLEVTQAIGIEKSRLSSTQDLDTNKTAWVSAPMLCGSQPEPS